MKLKSFVKEFLELGDVRRNFVHWTRLHATLSPESNHLSRNCIELGSRRKKLLELRNLLFALRNWIWTNLTSNYNQKSHSICFWLKKKKIIFFAKEAKFSIQFEMHSFMHCWTFSLSSLNGMIDYQENSSQFPFLQRHEVIRFMNKRIRSTFFPNSRLDQDSKRKLNATKLISFFCKIPRSMSQIKYVFYPG